MDLYSLDAAGLEALVTGLGEPRYRADQIRSWLYEKGATSADDMTDLPRRLREQLGPVGTMSVAAERTSSDGTVKRVYRLGDGQLIESVVMPYGDGRRTACISTQAGCAMGCVFCATGQMGFARHLTAGEI